MQSRSSEGAPPGAQRPLRALLREGSYWQMISGARLAAPCQYFVAALFRLLIGNLRREALAEHLDVARVLQAADDVGGEFARTVALLAVLENAKHQRRQFERHRVLVRQLIEQAHILNHQLHREIDVTAAVQDHLRFGFVYEGIARGDADRL